MLASKIKGRYGQTATNSAIFIAVTAAVILLYILALPPEDRAELLDDGSGSYISYGGSGAQIPAGRAPAIKALLFSVDAIHVDYLEKPEVSHKINAFTLRTLSEAATIKQFSSVQLSGNILALMFMKKDFMLNLLICVIFYFPFQRLNVMVSWIFMLMIF